MKRINRVDSAKAIGIILLYVGHWVEEVFRQTRDPLSFEIFRLIYAFHVPMFVVMSGMFFGTRAKMPLKGFLAHQIVKRLGFVTFFSLLMLPFWIWMADPSPATILQQALFGHPILAWPTWFLVALLVVELLCYPLVRRIHSPDVQWIALFVFVALSTILVKLGPKFLFTLGLPENFWFLNCIPWFGFMFLFGNAMGGVRPLYRLEKMGPLLWPCAIILLVAGAYFNPGIPEHHVVMPVAARTGDLLIFGLGVFGGSLMVWMLAKPMQQYQSILYVGRNSLNYLALNAIFFHFIAPASCQALLPDLPPSLRLGFALVAAAASLLLVSPLVPVVNWIWGTARRSLNLTRPPTPPQDFPPSGDRCPAPMRGEAASPTPPLAKPHTS